MLVVIGQVSLALALGQHAITQQRDQHHRGEPRGDQRDRRHLEDRTGVFAGAGLGQRDRQEARDRHERAGEHRERGARVRVGRGARAVPPLLELHGHHLDRDDRIVDEQAQREDQRAERDLVQADIEEIHEEGGDREHDRNRDHDDHPRAHAERHEAHDQHDHDRFGDGFQEIVDGIRHRVRHARHFRELQSGGKMGAQVGGLGVERFAETHDVLSRLHGDADAQHRLPARAHLRLRRIDIAALDRRDVAEAKRAAVHADQRVGERVDVGELAARTHEHAVVGRVQRAGGRDGVLAVDGLRDLLRRDVQARELRVRDLDIDPLFLVAEIIDLRDARHAQQHRAQLIGVVVQLHRRKTVAFERVDVRVDVAELVVEERTLHALRQRRRDIADLLAHLVPLLGHILRRRAVLHREEQQRFAGARIAAQEVGGGCFLQFLRDLVGDLFLHLRRGGAGPQGLDDHHAKRERRVFRLREPCVRNDAEDRRHRDQEDHQRAMPQRPRRQVEAAFLVAMVVVLPGFRRAHDAKSSGCKGATTRTFSPADTVCTPCHTTRSPAFRPRVTVTVRSP